MTMTWLLKEQLIYMYLSGDNTLPIQGKEMTGRFSTVSGKI